MKLVMIGTQLMAMAAARNVLLRSIGHVKEVLLPKKIHARVQMKMESLNLEQAVSNLTLQHSKLSPQLVQSLLRLQAGQKTVYLVLSLFLEPLGVCLQQL